MNYTHFLILIAFLIACVIAFLPTFSTGTVELFNEKRIAVGIVLFFGTFGFISLLLNTRLNILHNSTHYLWVLLFLLLIISIAVTHYPSRAILEVGWYLGLLQLSFIGAYLYQKYPNRFEQILLITLVCMASFYCIRVMGDFITGWIDSSWPNWPDHKRSTFIINGVNVARDGFIGFQNVRFLNHLQTWTLPILVYGYTRFSNSLNRGFLVLFGLLISFWWMLAFMSGARGTLLASAISLILVLFLFRKKCFRWLKVYGATLIAGVVLYYFFFYLMQEGSGKALARSGSTGRLDLWWASWEAIKNNPFFGLGPMHMANLQGTNPISSPHNMYLMWAAEWGLPAFGVALIIGATNFWKWIKLSLHKVSTRNIAITATLTAGAIHSGASGLLLTPLSQLLFAVILGWAIGIYYSNLEERVFTKRIKDSSYIKYGVLTVLLCINLFVFVRMGMDIPELQENREKFQSLHRQDRLDLFPTSYATIFPRFWDQGFIGLESYEDPKKLKNN